MGGSEIRRMCFKRQHAKDLVEIYMHTYTHVYMCSYLFKKSRIKLTVMLTVFFWGIETGAKMKMGI